ncbi:MAG: hypothetical protein J6V07_06205 [Clostridia bacterium]|nr:hypothetical protein [Clostridia bacterium]
MKDNRQSAEGRIGSSVRRLRLGEEPIYLLSILLMAVGVALTERGGLGLSMVVAPAYILAEATGLGFGTMEYVVQGALLLVMALLLRRFRLTYLFSFLTAFVYGLVLDGMLLLLSHLPAHLLALRILWFVLGAGVTAVAVALFFRVYLAPEAYDLFVRDVSLHFGIGQGRFKLIYDVASALLSVVLSFVFFGFGIFHGIGVGTLVLAFINGPIIGAVGRFFDRHFELYPMLPFKKYFR